jgi:hypothetical protein
VCNRGRFRCKIADAFGQVHAWENGAV